MSGHRQAALALYALADADQDAILAELPAADQAILRGLLDELAELGFDKAAADGVHPKPSVAGQDHAALMGATPAAMLTVLGHEPATLVAQLLALRSFPWAAAFLDGLPPHRRAMVNDAQRAVATAAPAPARAQFLLDASAAAVRALPAARTAPAPAPFSLSRWWPWTR
jgi:hypothetical protein